MLSFLITVKTKVIVLTRHFQANETMTIDKKWFSILGSSWVSK